MLVPDLLPLTKTSFARIQSNHSERLLENVTVPGRNSERSRRTGSRKWKQLCRPERPLLHIPTSHFIVHAKVCWTNLNSLFNNGLRRVLCRLKLSLLVTSYGSL